MPARAAVWQGHRQTPIPTVDPAVRKRRLKRRHRCSAFIWRHSVAPSPRESFLRTTLACGVGSIFSTTPRSIIL